MHFLVGIFILRLLSYFFLAKCLDNIADMAVNIKDIYSKSCSQIRIHTLCLMGQLGEFHWKEVLAPLKVLVYLLCHLKSDTRHLY